MERNYFDQPAAEFRTPRLHALKVPGKDQLILTWVCSPDDTIDQARWFFQVEILHLADGAVQKTERHHFLNFPEALRFRFHAAGIEKPLMLMDNEPDIMAVLNGVKPERLIAPVVFGDVPLWDGYTLQEVLNIRS